MTLLMSYAPLSPESASAMATTQLVAAVVIVLLIGLIMVVNRRSNIKITKSR